MTALPIDAADWSKGPSIGNGLVLNNQAITVPTAGQAQLGPYYVATAGSLVLGTTLGAPLSGHTVGWAVLWLDGNSVADANGFVSTWNQSSTLGTMFVSFPILGPYAVITAVTGNPTSVLAGVSAWKVAPGVGASTMFGPQFLVAFDIAVGAGSTQTLSMDNYIPGNSILSLYISASGGVIRFNDSNGLLSPATFFQLATNAINGVISQPFALPSSDFQILLGSGGAPACTYIGSIITLPT